MIEVNEITKRTDAEETKVAATKNRQKASRVVQSAGSAGGATQ